MKGMIDASTRTEGWHGHTVKMTSKRRKLKINERTEYSSAVAYFQEFHYPLSSRLSHMSAVGIRIQEVGIYVEWNLANRETGFNNNAQVCMG